jgi:hypothetical protein
MSIRQKLVEHYFKVPATVNETPKQDFNICHIIIELRNISRCVHTAVIMEPSMWHTSAIEGRVAHSPQVKESVCPTRESNRQAKPNKMEFSKWIRGYEQIIQKGQYTSIWW